MFSRGPKLQLLVAGCSLHVQIRGSASLLCCFFLLIFEPYQGMYSSYCWPLHVLMGLIVTNHAAPQTKEGREDGGKDGGRLMDGCDHWKISPGGDGPQSPWCSSAIKAGRVPVIVCRISIMYSEGQKMFWTLVKSTLFKPSYLGKPRPRNGRDIASLGGSDQTNVQMAGCRWRISKSRASSVQPTAATEACCRFAGGGWSCESISTLKPLFNSRVFVWWVCLLAVALKPLRIIYL